MTKVPYGAYYEVVVPIEIVTIGYRNSTYYEVVVPIEIWLN